MSKDKMYEMNGTPNPGDGRRLVPVDELFEMINGDPKIRDAIDLIEKVEGKPRAVTMLAYNMLRHNRESDMHVRAQKRAIDMAEAKRKGVLSI
jgi:hypothetical protein